MSKVRDFLAGRSGKRQVEVITIDGQEITLQSLTYRETSEIHLMWHAADGDTRQDAHQLRQAMFVSRALLDESGQRAFTDDEADLKVITEFMGKDMDAINAVIRRMNFAEAETLAKNLKTAKTNGS